MRKAPPRGVRRWGGPGAGPSLGQPLVSDIPEFHLRRRGGANERKSDTRVLRATDRRNVVGAVRPYIEVMVST